MNAILYKISHPTDLHVLESIVLDLHHHNFAEAEMKLLGLVEDIATREYNVYEEMQSALTTITILHATFNMFYRQHFSDIESIKSPAHRNVLIAHCSDPESMDDLLYEVSAYLKEFETDAQPTEALYHLHCYKGQFPH